MIAGMIECRLKITCSPRTLRRVLRRVLRKIHFSYRRIGRVPHKSASAVEQKRFMEEASGRVAGTRRRGHAIFSGGRANLPVATRQRPQLAARGEAKTTFPKKSVKAFCFAGGGNSARRRRTPQTRRRSRTRWAGSPRCAPKLPLPDGAAYNKPHPAKRYAAEAGSEPGREIVLTYPPPHAPQLNPAEIETGTPPR